MKLNDLRDLYLPELPAAWASEHAALRYVPVLSDATPDDRWDGRQGLVHLVGRMNPTTGDQRARQLQHTHLAQRLDHRRKCQRPVDPAAHEGCFAFVAGSAQRTPNRRLPDDDPHGAGRYRRLRYLHGPCQWRLDPDRKVGATLDRLDKGGCEPGIGRLGQQYLQPTEIRDAGQLDCDFGQRRRVLVGQLHHDWAPQALPKADEVLKDMVGAAVL